MRNAIDRKLLSQIGLLTGISVVLPAAETAQAAIITQNQTFSVTSSPALVSDPGTTSNSDSESTTITFNQFDPSLGTLTEVDIALASSLSISLTVTGSESSSTGAKVTGDASVTVTMLPGFSFSDAQNPFLQCGPFFCTSSNSFPFTEDSSSITKLLGPSINPYIGLGTVDAAFGLDLTLTADNLGSGFASGSGSASWDPPPIKGLSVTYIYTPTRTVPEPGTLALLGLGGMAGLGFARRRAKDG
jgi:PEP-CTERM motif